MSGNLYFDKTTYENYELVYNYESVLTAGEVIKTATVYVDDTEITNIYDDRLQEWDDRFVDISGNIIPNSGQFDDLYFNVFTNDLVKYDNSTILVGVNNGINTSGYEVKVSTTTNKHNTYVKAIDVFIDDNAYSNVYNELHYKYLVDDNIIYILPAAYYEDEILIPGFSYNREYTVIINNSISSVNDIYMIKNKSFWFTSKMCPMFTYASSIIMILGPEAEKFTLDTINRYIHRFSKEAIDLLNMSGSCGGSARIKYNHYGCTPDDVPYNLKRFVECKTAYSLLNMLDRLRLIDGSNGGQTKKLGDMTITYGKPGGGSGGGSDCPTCGPKKDLYDCWKGLEGILSNGANNCGVGGGINNAVRGLNDGSKGYVHPTRDGNTRVSNNKPNANGPWYQNGNQRYPNRRRF